MSYRTTDVAVRGGRLRVGVWESADLAPDATAERTVYAVHGITASHAAWELVADRVIAGSSTRVVAPDLRGRGRSSDLPGPWGMDQHADDLRAVADVFGRGDVTVGHSMGGFVVVVAGHRHPGVFGEVVLVDGGVPLALPAGVPIETVMQAILGPAIERLSMTFSGRAAYREFWRAHPAFAEDWSPLVEAYLDYDLVERTGGWHSSSRIEAVSQDAAEQSTGASVEAAWAAMRTYPVFLRSPLGLLAQPPGLYPPAALEAFALVHPGFAWEDVAGTNHYTLVMSDHGADRIAAAVAHAT